LEKVEQGENSNSMWPHKQWTLNNTLITGDPSDCGSCSADASCALFFLDSNYAGVPEEGLPDDCRYEANRNDRDISGSDSGQDDHGADFLLMAVHDHKKSDNNKFESYQLC
jgi:hypothetical protein